MSCQYAIYFCVGERHILQKHNLQCLYKGLFLIYNTQLFCQVSLCMRCFEQTKCIMNNKQCYFKASVLCGINNFDTVSLLRANKLYENLYKVWLIFSIDIPTNNYQLIVFITVLQQIIYPVVPYYDGFSCLIQIIIFSTMLFSLSKETLLNIMYLFVL